MWRTRGPRPCRGPRCCSTSSVIVRQAVKSQLHDGRVAADPPSPHVDESGSGFGLQVAIQHLRPPNIQHALSLHGPHSNADGVDLPALELQERPAAGDGGECSCDCPPSTSASSRTSDGSSTGNGRWRSSHGMMNSRDAAALTRRITCTRSTSELQGIVHQYRAQLNPIHIAAAIVKLAKLTAVESGRRRSRHGLLSGHGPQQGQGGQWQVGSEGRPVDATSAAASVQAAEGTRSGACNALSEDNDSRGAPTSSAADAHRRGRRRESNQDEGQVSSSNGNTSSSSSMVLESNTSRSSAESTISSTNDQSNAASRPGVVDHSGGGAAGAGQRRAQAANPPAPPEGPGPWLRDDSGSLGSHPPDRTHLARTSPSSALLADLVSCFLCQLPHYSARQYANVVWALAAMGSRDHPELLAAAAAQLQAQGGAKLFAAPPQELANLALGLAKLGYREVSLWAALIAAGKQRLHEFKPQELHNLAWAVAAASQDRSMISAAVQAALPQLRAFNASGLSNLLWSCATAQCHCEELFDGAAAALMALPPQDVNCQDVANAAWACAKLQHNHPRFMAHLARLVLAASTTPGGPGLRVAATQELVNTLWAFAALPLPRSLPLSLEGLQAPGGREADGGSGARDAARGAGGPAGSGLLSNGRAGGLGAGEHPQEQQWQSHWLPAPPARGEQGLSSGSPSGLDSLVVAAAQGPQTLGGDSSGDGSPLRSTLINFGGDGAGTGGLLESAVRVLVSELSRRPDLTPQGASNALWACARLQPCPLPPAGLAALLAAASRCSPRMSDQELSNTLWAAAELRSAGLFVPHDTVESIFAVACCASRLEGAAPAGLAQLVHAAVALRRVQSRYMDSLAQQVMARLPALGPQELCVMAVAVAEAVRIGRYCNPLLLNGLANAAVAGVSELCPQGISTLLWSFARAKHYHGPLTTTLCRAARPRLREFSDMEISNLVWALAVLKCQDRQLLVQAARVMVERVRLRRQRHAAAAAAAAETGDALQLQQHSERQEQEQRDRRERLFSVMERAPEEAEDAGEQPRRQEQAQKDLQQRQHVGQLLSEREEMASALASHRQQQRRRRQQQQQQQRQPRDADPVALREVASVSQLGPAGGGDGVELSEAVTTTWGPDSEWHVQGLTQQQHAAELRAAVLPAAAVSVALASSSDGGNSIDGGDGVGGSGAVAAGVPVVSVHPAASGPTASHPEARLRLRRLPSLHHHDDAEVALQPRRPPPRDACGDAAADGRRGAATAAASSRCTSATEPAAAAGGGGGILPQRAAALSSEDGDADADGLGADATAVPMPLDHAKSMSKLLWSYAKCNLYNQSLFRLLVQELQPVLRHATPHELALALWAVACHGHRCPELMEATAGLLLRGGRLQQLCPWDASVVAWAFAKLGHQHRGLFAALQQHARAAGAHYKEPCVLRLAWACAALEVPLHEELVWRVVEMQQRARLREAHSSYDGADGEGLTGANAARVDEGEG